MRRPTIALVSLLVTLPAQAATIAYKIDATASAVAFETDFGPDLITARIDAAG